MSCAYCKNKVKNEWIVKGAEQDSGIDVKIIKSDGLALLAVSGYYDGWSNGAVGVEPQFAPIKFCPMCGERLVGE